MQRHLIASQRHDDDDDKDGGDDHDSEQYAQLSPPSLRLNKHINQYTG